jgi:hypothetical protein
MGIPHSVTKTLAAASATAISLSHSPGAGAILIDGTASNRVSTTASSAAAANTVIIPLTTVSGVVAGSTITDSTAAVIPSGTTVIGVDTVNSKVILSQPIGGAGVGNGDTIVIGGVATLDTQRRVIITGAGDNHLINFTVNGTGDNGNPISDTFAGSAGTIAAISNLDFKTITSVTHTGSVTGAITIGTTDGSAPAGAFPTPAASTPWFGVNWHSMPVNIELAGIGPTGGANWSWQYTYDDPNNLPAGVAFPQPFVHPTLNAQTGSLDGSINDPVAAVRLVINSYTPAGTTSVRGTWVEAGISGQ